MTSSRWSLFFFSITSHIRIRNFPIFPHVYIHTYSFYIVDSVAGVVIYMKRRRNNECFWNFTRESMCERERWWGVGEIRMCVDAFFNLFPSSTACLLACSRSYSRRYVREILIKFSTKFSLVCVCLFVRHVKENFSSCCCMQFIFL